MTETSGHEIWHKKYKHMHNTGTESGYTQWSSPAGMSHMVYMDVFDTGSTSYPLQDMM